MRHHTGEKPFRCRKRGCSAAFTTKRNLFMHSTVHTGVKYFTCPVDGCNKTFLLKTGLEVHNRVHTGEKPYVCDFPLCSTACTTQGNLASHWQSIHSVTGQMRHKKQEERVARALKGEGLEFKREHTVTFCDAPSLDGTTAPKPPKFARLDFLLLLNSKVGGFVVIVSVDENSHKNYRLDCEVSRVFNVVSSLMIGGNSLPIVWIRYNPHAFKLEGKCRRVKKVDREKTLISHVKKLQNNKRPLPPLQLWYMFYDSSWSEKKGAVIPTITGDSGYPEALRECVTRTIVEPDF
jgi:hypothetical protein